MHKIILSMQGIGFTRIGAEPMKQIRRRLEMLELLQQPDTPIQAIFAGHVHFTHEAPLKNGLMQYVMDMSINGTIRKITILPECSNEK